MSAYTSWYRTGTVSITKGSNEVIGAKTYWTTAGIHAGDILKVGGLDYEIGEVADDTTLVLAETPKNSVSKSSYAVIRNFTAGMSTETAANVINLLGKFTRYVDADMQTVQGKSAYDLAKENGFTGTLAQWLDSLKAAGEWAELDDRTKLLTYNTAGLHNSIYRGKSLGSAITPEQIAAIKDGSFSNMWLGDNWLIGKNTYTIVHFSYYNSIETGNLANGESANPLLRNPHIVLVLTSGYLYDNNGAQINVRWSSSSSVVPEGGYFASELAAAYEDNGVIMKQIEQDLGADNLLRFRITSCNSFQNGECKEYTSKLVRGCPPTERQLFGERIYSIEERDPYNERVFAITHTAPYICPGCWGMKPLREIANSSYVCENHYGRSGIVTPSNSNASEVMAMCVIG